MSPKKNEDDQHAGPPTRREPRRRIQTAEGWKRSMMKIKQEKREKKTKD